MTVEGVCIRNFYLAVTMLLALKWANDHKAEWARKRCCRRVAMK